MLILLKTLGIKLFWNLSVTWNKRQHIHFGDSNNCYLTMSTLRKQTYLTQHSISGPLQCWYCTDYACGWWREPIYAESVQTEEQISRRFSESRNETNWSAIKPLANYSHRYSACLKQKSRYSNNLHKVNDDLQQLFCCCTLTVCLGLAGKARNKLIAIDNRLILVSNNIFKGTILISLRGPLLGNYD